MGLLHARVLSAGALTLGLCAYALPLPGPGFGTIRKHKISLEVRQPALVRLANTSVAFTGTSTNPEYVPVQGSLLATLQTELLSNENTLQAKPTPEGANWQFVMEVTGFAIPPPQTRTQNVGTQGTSLIWSGNLNVAYRILDHEGRVHDADNIDYVFQDDIKKTWLGMPIPGQGKPPINSAEGVKQAMIKEVVNQIAARLGNTSRPIDVQVATGEERLDRASDYMERRLWTRALEELEKGEPMARPEDESFRQYDMGLVYESIAYDSKSADDQRTNFFKAQEYYDHALELNPKEKYFIDTVARTRDSVARYKTLEASRREDVKVNTPKAPAPTEAAHPASAAPAQKALTVDEVLLLVASKVPEEQIIVMIQNRPVMFDYLDTATAVAFAKANVPRTIQNELRKKTGAPLLPEPAAEPAPVQAVTQAKAPVTRGAAPAKSTDPAKSATKKKQ